METNEAIMAFSQSEKIKSALIWATQLADVHLALAEADIKSDIISRSLAKTLEPYARPRAIRVIAKMPVTTTGKYDRKTIAKLF